VADGFVTFLFLLKGTSMLVLSRKSGQEIQIGEDIVITVISTGPGKVRLGVTAPAGLRVMRTELLLGGAADQTQDRTSEGVCGA
jgi:carbon storage regulator